MKNDKEVGEGKCHLRQFEKKPPKTTIWAFLKKPSIVICGNFQNDLNCQVGFKILLPNSIHFCTSKPQLGSQYASYYLFF